VTSSWFFLSTLNEKISYLFSSANYVRVIKYRRIRLAENVARMGKGEVYTEFWWGNLRQRDHLEDPAVDRMIIL